MFFTISPDPHAAAALARIHGYLASTISCARRNGVYIGACLDAPEKTTRARATAFRPLKAADIDIEAGDLNRIAFPKLVSPKIDGIRCLIRGGRALTAALKPIPNAFIRRLLETPELEGLDGELTAGCGIRATNSAVMAEQGEPDFTFHVFDRHDSTEAFEDRLASLRAIDHPRVRIVPHRLAAARTALLEIEREYLAAGYEGAVLRDPRGAYKHGRSTFEQQIALKLKRFRDEEATITGFTEQKKHPGRLAALIATSPRHARPIRIGTGFTEAERRELWAGRRGLTGAQVSFAHFPHGGYAAPRHPVFKCIRPEGT